MDDVKVLAATLLLGHVLALVVVVLVLSRQIKILRGKPDPTLQIGRLVLLALAVVIGLGNLVPIAIDAAVILGSVTRAKPSHLGVLYALSNVFTLILSASAVLALYVIAERLAKKLVVNSRHNRGKP